jgi:hypothetical protein
MAIDHLILSNRYQDAVDRTGVKNPNRVQHFLEASGVRDSILANLCVGRFETAQAMNDVLRDKFPKKYSLDYVHGGLIRWFQNRRKSATEIWEAGTNCLYAGYGGLDCAFLVWYAAVRYKSTNSLETACGLLTSKSSQLVDGDKDKVVARFLLGKEGEAALRDNAVNERWAQLTALDLVRAEFYIGLKHLLAGKRRQFRQQMLKCAQANGLRQLPFELLFARYEMKMFPFQTPKRNIKKLK